MNYLQIDAVRSKIIQAFADLERPDLRSILTLGCCEEHEVDFAWYRHHSWQEFEQEVLNDTLDWVEFSVLHPVAYHYFVPGILVATLESIFKRRDWLYFSGELWITTLVPLEKNSDSFRREYLSRFSDQQIEAVASYLELFQLRFIEMRGYGDQDIERVLREIWRSNST